MSFFPSSREYRRFMGNQNTTYDPYYVSYPAPSWPDSSPFSRPQLSAERASLYCEHTPITDLSRLMYHRPSNLEPYYEHPPRRSNYSTVPAGPILDQPQPTPNFNFCPQSHNAESIFHQQHKLPPQPWTLLENAAVTPEDKNEEEQDDTMLIPSSLLSPTPIRKQKQYRRKRQDVLRDIKHLIFTHRLDAPFENIVARDPKTLEACVVKKIRHHRYITSNMPPPLIAVFRFCLPDVPVTKREPIELELGPESEDSDSGEGRSRRIIERRKLSMMPSSVVACLDLDEEPLTFPHMIMEVSPSDGHLIGDDGIPWLVNQEFRHSGPYCDTFATHPGSQVDDTPPPMLKQEYPPTYDLLHAASTFEHAFHIHSNVPFNGARGIPLVAPQHRLPTISVMDSNAWVLPPPTPIICPAAPPPLHTPPPSWTPEVIPAQVDPYDIRRDSLGVNYWQPQPPSSFPRPPSLPGPNRSALPGADVHIIKVIPHVPPPQGDVMMSQNLMSVLLASVAAPPPRAHVCEVCEKSFERPSSLTTHMLTHSGKRPYQCQLLSCGQSFTIASNLRRHARSHGPDGYPKALAPTKASTLVSDLKKRCGKNKPTSSKRRPQACATEAPAVGSRSISTLDGGDGGEHPSNGGSSLNPQDGPLSDNWLPESLKDMSNAVRLTSCPPFDAASFASISICLPAAAVHPSEAPSGSSRSFEERNSFAMDVAESPYHPDQWSARSCLPGPGLRDASELTQNANAARRLLFSH